MPSNSNLAPLFEPVRLGALELKNRIVMAPLTRSRSSDLAVPPTFAADYYAQRASAGLIITEATQISYDAMGYSRTPGAHTDAQLKIWASVADAVHAKGGKIVMQLWHVGRIASRLNTGVARDVVAPSAIAAPGKMYTDAKGMVDHDVPRALETHEIAAIAKDFASAARNAIDAGFDGVEIHSANGYLLHQFLSSNVNQRTDQYGGSVENRVRMPLEVVEAVIGAVPRERVGLRVSPGHVFNGIEETDLEALYGHYLPCLESYGLAYLHVMRPTSNTMALDPVTMARGLFKGSLIAAANYDADSGAALLKSGGADAIAFGRAYIANPDLVERLKVGAPLNTPHEATFYTPGEKGYTDYPSLAA
ncbi:MAG: alkene reductase [Hyphomicrobium sp.]|nr:MAG: alkene reductase [Hyphomicrobium sp.]PPC99655.1 MAG: alkene reductase [Hyphomicrobium sp.]